ncbi:unnamed protein product [Acanthoscelides obtectus]|uniref:DNA polymerase n=1 Tax=Acanthoscelides obtectus TaxID=200917 RepID=A0A9P0PHJ1_ACAOB|nr:unnamed protein product [Acanthoscelides obtectus]CAK1675800.1 DNA polymerase alpha catalytic subunit [Acanthoscelides obtectus]
MADSSEESRPKRMKRDTSYKAKAFEKFKQLKSGNRNKYEVEELESVYELVDEKDYVKKVLSRQDEDWIVDDDGSGYIEDGRDIFDDDLDSESIAQAQASGRDKGKKRKKKAVSENAGKGNLAQMLSNMPVKKKEEIKIDEDAMLTEILEEIDDHDGPLKPKQNKITEDECSIKSRKQAAMDYMKSFSVPAKKPPSLTIRTPKKDVKKENIPENTVEVSKIKTEIVSPKPVAVKKENNSGESTQEKRLLNGHASSQSEVIKEETPSIIEDSQVSAKDSEEMKIEDDFTQECFDDDLDMSVIEDFESQEMNNKAEETEDPVLGEWQTEFSTAWENEETVEINSSVLDKTDIPLVVNADGKKVLRFFWWDAFEDAERHKGVIFLFGKTYCEKVKNYVSCCVAVRNINRQIFFLPRTHVLGDDGKSTDEPVTFKKLYEEVNDTIMKPLKINSFRARYVHKKYAFDPEVPADSDYMEVRYPPTDPKIDINSLRRPPRTFWRIFGGDSPFLELLLLERRIRGPCWLDISDPVPVNAPVSWCALEVNCSRPGELTVFSGDGGKQPPPPPPLVVLTLHMRTAVNPKTHANEILMVSCLAHDRYALDGKIPHPPFKQHFCVFTNQSQHPLPLDIHEALNKYRATKVQKMGSEKALLNYLVAQLSKIDADLIVGHDLHGRQVALLAERLTRLDVKNFGKLGKLRITEKKRLDRRLFAGRLVCDIKITAKELIKSKSYDLEALCQVVLKMKENQFTELEPGDIPKMFGTSGSITRLISLTMQEASYILRIMYELNAIPLALQITNIAGCVMSRTLLGGRSERNEFLLLHAFAEKDYIVPAKQYKKNDDGAKQSARKKPTYSGGLVLEPKVGFYDKLVLLMDFNSLYPSIIQEYNICFTTLPASSDREDAPEIVLPSRDTPPGVLPTEIRKLVESRREVKKLMNAPDIASDQRMQYNIRQMALKLTANSMYGCLGFSNSRFYARSLAALVTHKGREILTHTKDLVEKMGYEVVYGDTDSIMISTNLLEYDQVTKIGLKIKQEVNKLYRQVELDVDGVFKYLLLLKKKKYAAVTLSKGPDGKLREIREYKGLDIVRRDWSPVASESGKFVLEHILSDQSSDERAAAVQQYLCKLRSDLEEGRVPLPLLVITKQLTKDVKAYADAQQQPHVRVALRMEGRFRAGDTVPYVVCTDGTTNPPTQRTYHIEELKKRPDDLKIDAHYYLAQQVQPVISRICEPVEGIDAFLIAECLGVEAPKARGPASSNRDVGENTIRPEVRYRNAGRFRFQCLGCKVDLEADDAGAWLGRACSSDGCRYRPVDYLAHVQNQLTLSIRGYIERYYDCELTCEDPACLNVSTRRLPLRFVRRHPVCFVCKQGVLYRTYNEGQLYTQIAYFRYLMDPSRFTKTVLEYDVQEGYFTLMETVEEVLNDSGYSVINLSELFAGFEVASKIFAQKKSQAVTTMETYNEYYDDDDDDL